MEGSESLQVSTKKRKFEIDGTSTLDRKTIAILIGNIFFLLSSYEVSELLKYEHLF